MCSGKTGQERAVSGRFIGSLTFACFPSSTDLRFQLLKHTKCDIVHALCGLPKTQHDLKSFMVDMWFQTVGTCFLPCWEQGWEAADGEESS